MSQLNSKRFEIPSKASYKLDTMIAASDSVGNPQWGRKTILVAGTNGKGSVCAYLTALLKAQGFKVGTYISPHIVNREERIRINGRPIAAAALKKLEKQYAKALEPLTYFERFTLLGFLYFRQARVDVQVIEVGMGGRLDATNICEPDISVITALDLDHQEVLGNTLAEIASEKAGIMRKDRLCWTVPQAPEAMRALKAAAAERGAELRVVKSSLRSQGLNAQLKRLERDFGRPQLENARIAAEVFHSTAQLWNFKIKPSIWKLALHRRSLWAARMQLVRSRPIFLIDGSHNPHSIAALVQKWGAQFKRAHLVFGAMKDKDIGVMLRPLLKGVHSAVFPEFYPERQESPAVLKSLVGKTSQKISMSAHLDLKEIVKEAIRIWKAERRPVLVAGSLYLSGKFLGELKAQKFKVEDQRL